MASPGHRKNILNPTHRKLNIGIARDDYNIALVQHFEVDYMRYDSMPEVSADGVLSLAGRLVNGAHISHRNDLGVQIYYDPPPHPLARGQLSRTYCYSTGLRVASLRPPLEPGWFYDSHSYTYAPHPCPDPYDVSADAPGPKSAQEAKRAWRLRTDQVRTSPERQRWFLGSLLTSGRRHRTVSWYAPMLARYRRA